MEFPGNLCTNNELERIRGKLAFPFSKFKLTIGPRQGFPRGLGELSGHILPADLKVTAGLDPADQFCPIPRGLVSSEIPGPWMALSLKPAFRNRPQLSCCPQGVDGEGPGATGQGAGGGSSTCPGSWHRHLTSGDSCLCPSVFSQATGSDRPHRAASGGSIPGV